MDSPRRDRGRQSDSLSYEQQAYLSLDLEDNFITSYFGPRSTVSLHTNRGFGIQASEHAAPRNNRNPAAPSDRFAASVDADPCAEMHGIVPPSLPMILGSVQRDATDFLAFYRVVRNATRRTQRRCIKSLDQHTAQRLPPIGIGGLLALALPLKLCVGTSRFFASRSTCQTKPPVSVKNK